MTRSLQSHQPSEIAGWPTLCRAGGPPGADLPAMLRSTGFRGSGPRSRVQAVLFEKALTLSDTSHLGRIVLPKGCAEKYLPPMDEKEGRPIVIEDNYGARWCFRYRFWPNNKSKMYVLEHSGDFLRAHRLRVGDVVQFCRSELGHLIVQGKKEAARQAAGLAPGGASPRAAPLRAPRELRPPTCKRSPATSRPRRRGARGPLIPHPGVASFDEVRARAREVSMTSEELLRSSREIRAEMRASLARKEGGGVCSAAPYGSDEADEQQFEADPQKEQRQGNHEEEEEEQLQGPVGAPGLYDLRAGFSPPRPPSVPPLTGEGPFRLASLYPAHLYSELARSSSPGAVYQPIPRPTPHYLAPPWSGALQASLFPWAGSFAGTPGFGLETGPPAFGGVGLPLGGFNLEAAPPDVTYAGSHERDERETPTMGEIHEGRWQRPVDAERGEASDDSSRERAAGNSEEGAQAGQEAGRGDAAATIGRELDEDRHGEVKDSDADGSAGRGAAASGGLQAMPRGAGMDAVEHSLALLSGRGGRDMAEAGDAQGGGRGARGERQKKPGGAPQQGWTSETHTEKGLDCVDQQPFLSGTPAPCPKAPLFAVLTGKG
ncbi:B3 DNA binding domain containing protein [Klebsormidium nitens]|uniref:B3 DNA binding domain containing protein n=1 Tax=Klebsormidium nitens TaxID=105231 RepID=A0A1Y1I0G0_KLENI|nr:B3 DNA binding domain containing protein [Klebsormidium nitens]|eukprot:GAQ81588.1 B3 DNA binding domain containing protein [Klebsormidium nitens]